MYRIIRFIVGAFAVLIGVAGTIFSGVAIVQSWELAERLGREVPATVVDLERVVESVRQQGDTTLGLIDSARDRVRFVAETVEELAGLAEERPATPSLLETLDPDIERRLEAAETFILAMQESLLSLNRALVMLDSLPLFPRRFPSGNLATERPAKSVASSMAEASSLLDEASRTLARLRSGQALSPRQLAQFHDLLDEVDRALRDVRGEIGTFFDSIEQAGSRLAQLRVAAPIWIDRVAVVSTAFFVCFGASQLSLLLHGWLAMVRALAPSRRWQASANGGMLADVENAPPAIGGADDRPAREAE